MAKMEQVQASREAMSASQGRKERLNKELYKKHADTLGKQAAALREEVKKASVEEKEAQLSKQLEGLKKEVEQGKERVQQGAEQVATCLEAKTTATQAVEKQQGILAKAQGVEQQRAANVAAAQGRVAGLQAQLAQAPADKKGAVQAELARAQTGLQRALTAHREATQDRIKEEGVLKKEKAVLQKATENHQAAEAKLKDMETALAKLQTRVAEVEAKKGDVDAQLVQAQQALLAAKELALRAQMLEERVSYAHDLVTTELKAAEQYGVVLRKKLADASDALGNGTVDQKEALLSKLQKEASDEIDTAFPKEYPKKTTNDIIALQNRAIINSEVYGTVERYAVVGVGDHKDIASGKKKLEDAQSISYGIDIYQPVGDKAEVPLMELKEKEDGGFRYSNYDEIPEMKRKTVDVQAKYYQFDEQIHDLAQLRGTVDQRLLDDRGEPVKTTDALEKGKTFRVRTLEPVLLSEILNGEEVVEVEIDGKIARRFEGGAWYYVVDGKMDMSAEVRLSSSDSFTLKELGSHAHELRLIASGEVVSVKDASGKAVTLEVSSKQKVHPLGGLGRISSHFSPSRKDPVYGRGYRAHTGVDIAAALGTPIYSTDSGRVIYAGWMGGYGYAMDIQHPDGTVSRYAHCRVLKNKVGDQIQRGQQIAEVGSTGHSTGPHVHWEIRKNGVPQNPMNSLA